MLNKVNTLSKSMIYKNKKNPFYLIFTDILNLSILGNLHIFAI